jgi:hypothetical protein
LEGSHLRGAPKEALGKSVPKAEHDHPAVLKAATIITQPAEGRDLITRARIAALKAIHRHEARQFNPNAKEHHWGKRKLKRDR